jgi:hypothetical protein
MTGLMVKYIATVGFSTIVGSSMVILYVNKLPSGGNCSISQTSGVAVSTLFNVTCAGWDVPGGSIYAYELNGIYTYI